MERMPIAVLVFYSIPESVILISLSAALYGYNVRANFKRICLLGAALAFTTYVVRMLPVKVGYHIFVEMPIFAVLTACFLKLSLRRAFIIIFTGFMIITMTESFYAPLVVNITGKDIQTIAENPGLGIAVFGVLLLILLLPTIYVVKKRISFASGIQFFNNSTLNFKLSFLVVILLVQSFLAGFLQLSFVYAENKLLTDILNPSIVHLVVGYFLIIIPVISLFFLKKLFVLSEQENSIAALESYVNNVNDLFLAVKSQRHDFINHIQVITGLVQLKKYDEALQYGRQLYQEGQETQEALNLDDPTIAALVKAKSSIAMSRRIRFKVNSTADTLKLAVKPHDLIKILGNLLDNALDATAEQSEDLRRVYFNIRPSGNSVIFQVTNLGPVIPPDRLEHIFEEGFSTKGGGHTGTGLAVVKRLAGQYKGQIEVVSNPDEGTIFTVTLPCKE